MAFVTMPTSQEMFSFIQKFSQLTCDGYNMSLTFSSFNSRVFVNFLGDIGPMFSPPSRNETRQQKPSRLRRRRRREALHADNKENLPGDQPQKPENNGNDPIDVDDVAVALTGNITVPLLSSTSNSTYDVTELPNKVDICEDEEVSISQESVTTTDAIADVPNSFKQPEDNLDETKDTTPDDLSKLLDDIEDRLTASISTNIISQMSG